MSKRACSLIAAAAVLATTQLATAADVEQPQDFNNWYFAISGGLNQIFETDFDGDYPLPEGEVEFDYGGRGGVALGYYWDDHWRTEIELGFSSTGADEFSPDSADEYELDGSLDIFTALAKIDYEMEFGWWRPYLGIGAGVAVLSADDIGADGGPSVDASDTVFAGAVEAGSKFILSDVAELFSQTQLLIMSDADIEGTLETPLVLSSSVGLRFRF